VLQIEIVNPILVGERSILSSDVLSELWFEDRSVQFSLDY
jgi:hypothetical protein